MDTYFSSVNGEIYSNCEQGIWIGIKDYQIIHFLFLTIIESFFRTNFIAGTAGCALLTSRIQGRG
jgi:hypothetical protein